MPDTAEAIFKIIGQYPPDIYHLDGNFDHWDFYTLACHLKETFKLPSTIEAEDDTKRNNQLINTPNFIRSIKERLDMIHNH